MIKSVSTGVFLKGRGQMMNLNEVIGFGIQRNKNSAEEDRDGLCRVGMGFISIRERFRGEPNYHL